jgi:hypothetical protein
LSRAGRELSAGAAKVLRNDPEGQRATVDMLYEQISLDDFISAVVVVEQVL